MLPAISEFLSGTVTGTLKQVLQPASLFVAALFLFLNLVFVLRPLRGLDNTIGVFSNAVLSLNAVWLLAVATAAVVVLAYILTSLSGPIYRLMTGEAWGEAWLVGGIAKKLQLKRWERIEANIHNWDLTVPIRSRAKYETTIQFPPGPPENEENDAKIKREDHFAPTRLGNVLNATANNVWERYQIDFTTLWPHMQIAIEEKKALKERIDNEKAILDFLLLLSFALIIFVIECLVLEQLPSTALPLNFWHYVILILLAWGIYHAGALKAESWGQAVLMTFDQEQESLRKTLSMEPFDSRDTARKRWKVLSEYMAYGDVEGGQPSVDRLFDKAKSVQTPTAIASPNVSIMFQHEKVTLQKPETVLFSNGQGVHYYKGEIRYVVLVSNEVRENRDIASWPDANGVFVIVDEQRVPRIDSIPLGGPDWDVHEISPKRLIWQLKKPLRANETAILRYKLPIVNWTAKSNHKDLIFIASNCSISEEKSGQPGLKIKLGIKNKGTANISNGTVDVFDSRITKPSDYKPPSSATELGGVGYCFELIPIKSGMDLTPSFTVLFRAKSPKIA